MRVDRYHQQILSMEYLCERFWSSMNSPRFREAILDDRLTEMAVGTRKDGDTKYSRHLSVMLLNGDRQRVAVIPDELSAALDAGIDSYDDPASAGKLGPMDWNAPGFPESVEKALDEAAKPEVRHNPALDLVALMYAREGRIDSELRRHLIRSLGVTGKVTYSHRRIRDEDGVDPHMVASMKADMEEEKQDEEMKYVFGAARIPYREGSFVEAVLLLEKEVELAEPLGMTYEPGEEIVVTGRFLGEAEYPEMLIDLGEGRVSSWEIHPDEAGNFAAKVPVPESPGRHLLEIDSAHFEVENDSLSYGSHVEMMIPIRVVAPGDPAPADDRLEDLVAPPDPGAAKLPEETSTWVTIVEDTLNAARRNCGLKPLRRNPVAEAMIGDALFQLLYTFEHRTFNEINKELARQGGGHMRMMTVFSADDLRLEIQNFLAHPNVSKTLMDEKTTMLAAMVEPETETVSVALMADFDDDSKRGEDPGKHIAAAASPVRATLPPKIGAMREKVFKKVPQEKIIDIARCYQNLADIDEDAEGEIDVFVAVGRRGKVIGSFKGESTVFFDETEECIVNAVRKWRFEEPAGGVYLGKLSFVLEKRGKKHYVQLK